MSCSSIFLANSHSLQIQIKLLCEAFIFVLSRIHHFLHSSPASSLLKYLSCCVASLYPFARLPYQTAPSEQAACYSHGWTRSAQHRASRRADPR